MRHTVPVSVIIPYDRDRGYLKDAIKSVVNQTVKCEIIIWQGNHWLSKNINDAIRISKGKYIKIFAEDDLLPKNAIEDLYYGVQGYDWICADAENFGELKYGWEECPLWIGHVPTFEEMLITNEIHGGTTIYSKDMIRDIGGWDESLWTGEEYDLHLRLMKNDYKLGYIHKIVYRYRLHNFNKSMFLDEEGKLERREYIKTKIRRKYV